MVQKCENEPQWAGDLLGAVIVIGTAIIGSGVLLAVLYFWSSYAGGEVSSCLRRTCTAKLGRRGFHHRRRAAVGALPRSGTLGPLKLPCVRPVPPS